MRFLAALVVAGCGFSGANTHDGSTTPDVPEGCLGTGAWLVCPPQPLSSFSFGATFDTGDAHCISDPVWRMKQDDACIIAASSLEITTPLAVTGTRPLVLVASGDITIASTLDVSSAMGRTGPYTPDAACNAGNGTDDTGTGGGGGGGGFGALGAKGGEGNNKDTTQGSAGMPVQFPVDKLRGGCPGGKGGNGGGTGGVRGEGGGAVYLVAGGTLKLMATINASGAGGTPGSNGKAGGGGGGSGGMIVMFAANLTAMPSAKIFTNGGGGGGGADQNNPGTRGGDPTMPMTAATGGPGGGGAGARGGDGAVLQQAPMDGSNAGGGGGGGGGGGSVGVIRVISGQTLGSALVSPAPS